MAETVTVSSSPGANYTWTTGKFAWSSATAGKNWTSAYPAVYSLSVATDISFTELIQKLGIKRSSETIAFAEKQGKGLVLNKFEIMSFAETYTDLIAFVLRFVESFALAEKYGLSNTKRVFEVFQVAEGLARQIALSKYETLALAETPEAFVRALAKAGYATDPIYADKVIGVISKHNLTTFDGGIK